MLESVKEARSDFLEEIEQDIEIEISYEDNTLEGFGFKVLDKKRFDDVISKYKHKQVAD